MSLADIVQRDVGENENQKGEHEKDASGKLDPKAGCDEQPGYFVTMPYPGTVCMGRARLCEDTSQGMKEIAISAWKRQKDYEHRKRSTHSGTEMRRSSIEPWTYTHENMAANAIGRWESLILKINIHQTTQMRGKRVRKGSEVECAHTKSFIQCEGGRWMRLAVREIDNNGQQYTE